MNRFSYTLHNMIGHPMMEILRLLGFTQAANWIHDRTLLDYEPHEASRRAFEMARAFVAERDAQEDEIE